MARGAIQTIRDIGKGITPIVIGFLLVQGTVSFAVLGAFNAFLGWALVIVGILDIVNSLR